MPMLYNQQFGVRMCKKYCYSVYDLCAYTPTIYEANGGVVGGMSREEFCRYSPREPWEDGYNSATDNIPCFARGEKIGIFFGKIGVLVILSILSILSFL